VTDRFYVPAGGSTLAAFRAFRAFAEKIAEEQGKTLSESWYKDGPEDMPYLYERADEHGSNDE
jgi:hypothetical protein